MTIQGFKFAVSISLTLHLLVVLLLINTTDDSIKNLTTKPKIKPINSFIYHKPIEKVEDKTGTALVNNDKNKDQIKMPPLKEAPQPPMKVIESEKTFSGPKVKNKKIPPLTEMIVSPIKAQQEKPTNRQSSLQSLSRLKDKINQRIINQGMYNYTKPNTGSVMHGEPRYVPHSFTEDTEKKAIATTSSQVGNGFSVRKDDNGNCTLTEDLSTVGLQGKTTSGFGCGLSKDEKLFKNHMKNVLKKLGK
jgi:hypothetical protein